MLKSVSFTIWEELFGLGQLMNLRAGNWYKAGFMDRNGEMCKPAGKNARVQAVAVLGARVVHVADVGLRRCRKNRRERVAARIVSRVLVIVVIHSSQQGVEVDNLVLDLQLSLPADRKRSQRADMMPGSRYTVSIDANRSPNQGQGRGRNTGAGQQVAQGRGGEIALVLLQAAAEVVHEPIEDVDDAEQEPGDDQHPGQDGQGEASPAAA